MERGEEMNGEEKKEYLTNQDNWTKARPQHIPRPTYWPFFLAMGLAFAVWGLLTSWIIGLAGLVVMTVAFVGWINELRHESGKKRD
jgi:hypothetical protein